MLWEEGLEPLFADRHTKTRMVAGTLKRLVRHGQRRRRGFSGGGGCCSAAMVRSFLFVSSSQAKRQ